MAITQFSEVIQKGRGFLNRGLAALSPRVAGGLCVVLLAMAFKFPLWRIELYAPQYPEGLTMYIWINHMAGDVGPVNLLNHYVGMKPIDALSIPELVFMPKVLLGLIALLVVTSLPNRRWLLATWYSIFFTVGVIGLWDFYSWEFDYGHNLNPHAPIQMAGMDYQPPLFGAKTLLNITAISLPDWGGIAIFVAAAVALVPLVYPLLLRKKALRPPSVIMGLLVLFMGAGFWGCTPKGPGEIHLGQDACDSCRMTISDAKFGGEIRLIKGKLLKFDSIECLLSSAKSNFDQIRTIYVEDILKPGHLIEAESATFVRSPKIRGPMGTGWIATSHSGQLRSLLNGIPTEEVRWKDVISTSP